ncbi:hypothetical protein DNTS_025570 [Danionella cerebrum]|uniref:Caspase-8 n=1 Tax=Danionella cerebrum TaxID=2873325 RepID=A0A553PYN7_9TELE|nr:hypothetical protein DNTS_025570 [Danionella translucida]
MDFERFHEIDENLTSSDVSQMKFLCMDLVPKRRLEKVVDGKDLFMRLEEQALLEDGLLIPELLLTIGRLDLLDILETCKGEVERNLLQRDDSTNSSVINTELKLASLHCQTMPQRRTEPKMLLEISEGLTEENFRTVKFLLDLPKAKLGTSASFLDALIEMEKQQKLGEDNLEELHDVLEKCDKQLASRIEQFQAMSRQQEQGGTLPLQEVFNNDPFSPMPVADLDGGKEESLFGRNFNDRFGYFTPDGCYRMTQRPLGHCLIINNFKFMNSTDLKPRAGTDKDKDDLSRVFERMHFQVEVLNDLRAADIKDTIKQFAERNHSEMGAFVCCVLSHGEKGKVLGVDGKSVEIRELTLPFAECLSLTSKPKLFFIQACQGNRSQDGVWAEDGQMDDAEEGAYEDDAQQAAYRSIPMEADFLIGMATVEHHQSYRHTSFGSIYIQELCRKLEELCPRKEDILSILTKVNYEVSKKILNGKKQMPEPRYTLTKKLVLPMD